MAKKTEIITRDRDLIVRIQHWDCIIFLDHVEMHFIEK